VKRECFALLVLATLASCGGQAAVYEYLGTQSAPSGGADAGGAPSAIAVAGASSPASGGEASGASGASGAANFGRAGEPGAGGSGASMPFAGSGPGGASGAGGSSGGQSACMSAADCPRPLGGCKSARCAAGICSIVVDQNMILIAANPCLAGTCNSSGTPGMENVPARTGCAANNGVMCDGKGSCVQCLKSTDCAQGLSCSVAHQCVAASCTDLDCGGVCPACALGLKCLVDRDCVSNACDAVTLTCIADQCADHQRDGNESDVDCGGPCATKCAQNKGCNDDPDCVTNVCDVLLRMCITDACVDHHTDALETDTDCGGLSSCSRCAANKYCTVNADCASHVCEFGSPSLCQ
jgi:hypothetical protein